MNGIDILPAYKYAGFLFTSLRILICVNGGLKHVNTPDSYLRERCAKRTASVLSVA